MGKIIFFLLLSFRAFSFSLENYYQIDDDLIDKIFLKKDFLVKYEDLFKETVFDTIKDDPYGRIDDEFNIPKYFEKSTRFWFNVYTLHNSSYVAIHDKKYMDLVYDVVNFSELKETSLNIYTKSSLQNTLVLERVREIRGILNKLKNSSPKTDREKSVLKLIKEAGIDIPKNKKKKKKLFSSLSQNLRSQTGQKEILHQALNRFGPFEKTINYFFDLFNLPRSLIALTFLESSFQFKAKSKAGAVGPWQFMWRVSRVFMEVNKTIDSRLNPIISTLGAIHLLKQNKMILKRWDLAVTAYNSGTKHIMRARKKLKKKVFSIEEYFKGYKHQHLGFASQNYFSSFLALTFALSYKEKAFADYKKEYKTFKQGKLDLYLSKCKIKPKILFNYAKSKSKDFKVFNNHFKNVNKKYNEGKLIVSDFSLPSKYYYKLSERNIKNYYPKKMYKIIRSKKCGK